MIGSVPVTTFRNFSSEKITVNFGLLRSLVREEVILPLCEDLNVFDTMYSHCLLFVWSRTWLCFCELYFVLYTIFRNSWGLKTFSNAIKSRFEWKWRVTCLFWVPINRTINQIWFTKLYDHFTHCQGVLHTGAHTLSQDRSAIQHPYLDRLDLL